MKRISAAVMLFSAVILPLACSDGGTGPDGKKAVPSALALAGGNAQAGTVGEALTDPLVVKVTDQKGQPVGGVSIAWAVTSGGGSLSATTSATDNAGQASIIWTLGTTTGENKATATVGSLTPATFTATGKAGAAAKVEKLQGEAQSGTVALPLKDSLSVKVTDTYGNAVASVAVNWAVGEGGGSTSPTTSMTDTSGVAKSLWTAGQAAGKKTATATVEKLAPATFSAAFQAATATKLVNVSGDQQSATVGTVLKDSVVVRATDEYGNPVGGVSVAWNVAQGAGSITPAIATTDTLGLARGVWTLGTTAGANSINASGAGATVSFSATGTAGAAAKVEKVSGDAQTGAPGSALPSPLVVKGTDKHGNAVGGATVTWAVATGGGNLEKTSTATTSEGLAHVVWTLGPAVGNNSVTASVADASVTFTAQAASVDTTVTLQAISPAILIPGESATITGSGFSVTPGKNSVTVGGVPVAISASTSTQLTVKLPARSSFSCEPTRDVTVQVAAGGKSGTKSHPLQVAVQRKLAAGESFILLGGSDIRCNELAESSGRYIVSVFNTSTTLSASSAFQLRGQGAASTSAVVRSTSGLRPSMMRSPAPGEALEPGTHTMLLEKNRELLRRLSPKFIRNATQTRLFQANTVALAPGDTLRVRIPDINADKLCETSTEVTARVVYAGTRGIILEDKAAPLAGQMDADYQAVGREFDNRMLGILEANFGNPLAVDPYTDNNGKILMVFSKVVNDAKKVSGFVFSGDFFPRTSCASSNQAEIFYAVVPTSIESGYSAGTRGQWNWTMPSTIIHEVKHITSYAERLARNPSAWEESWLEESTARISEELWARAVYGYNQKGNVTHQQSLYCESRPSWPECSGKPLVMRKHFGGLYDYQSFNETLTPLGKTGEEDSSFYGSGWSLVRWSIDHLASSESAFLKALTQEPHLSGVRNLEERTGRAFPQLIGNWSLAMAVDDHPGFTSSNSLLRFPSWNTRDVFGGLNEDFPNFYTKAFPLGIRTVSFGTFSSDVPQLRAGSAAVFELSGSQPGRQLIELRSQSGGDPAPTLRLGVVRVQ